jgi:ankyrin repeat protein
MRNLMRLVVAAALGFSGLGMAGVVTGGAAAVQVDPWDNARYLIGVKKSAEALALIDSGQFDINMANDEGYTLLHFAAEAGDLGLVKAMLDRGADPNAKTNNPALMPYQMAYSTMVKAELRKAMSGTRMPGPGANIPPAAPVAAAPAPAPAAGPVATGRTGMARNDPASSSRSPAMRPFLAAKDAVWYNHPDELTGLIEDCVKVNMQDEYGWTLLHQAAQRDRVVLARILLDHGASKTLRNKDGETPGMLATSPEMKALLGGSTAAKPRPANPRDTECQQKYQADVALCSDSACRMGANRKWQQCLKTGRYW